MRARMTRKDKRENGKSEKRQEPVKPPSVVTKPPAVPSIKPGNYVNNCLQNKFNGKIRGTLSVQLNKVFYFSRYKTEK